jgi:hypothetical protein
VSQLYYVASWYGTRLGFSFIGLIPLEGKDPEKEKLVLRDRGDYPRNGSGPWFCAVAESNNFVPDQGYPDVSLTGTQHLSGQTSAGWQEGEVGIDGMCLYNWIQTNHKRTDYTGKIFELDGYILYYRQGSSWSTSLASDPIEACRKAAEHASRRQIGDIRRISNITRGSFPPPLSFNYKFGEHNTFLMAANQGAFINGSASRWQAAYVRAWENLPQASTNTLANISEGIGLVKGILSGLDNPGKALSEVAESLSDPRNAWLAYRYSYNTSKADAKEYARALRAMRDLKRFASQRLRVSARFVDGTGSYGAVIWYDTSVALPATLDEVLSYSGLNLNASNLWDMVPYSFVADWFLKLGDLFSQFENWTYSAEVNPSEVWYTYKSDYDTEQGHQEVTYRVPGRLLPIPPAYRSSSASGKTVMMRIADTISLFT